MPNDDEFDAQMRVTHKLGVLEGENRVLRDHYEHVTNQLAEKQDECDQLRARAACSEGLLANAQKTLDEIAGVKL